MGNNSPHFLDIVRWGLGVGFPTKTVSLGARLFNSGDDWQWPDTQSATYQYDTKDKLVKQWNDPSASEWIQSSTGASYLDTNHVGNWVEAIRSGDPRRCHANPGVAVATSQMAHTANMACDSGETIRLDGATGALLNAQTDVRKLWSREYEKGWGPRG